MMPLVSAPGPPSCRRRGGRGQPREQPAIAGPRLVDAEPQLHRPHARGDGMDDRDAELALERLDDVEDPPTRTEEVDPVGTLVPAERIARETAYLRGLVPTDVLEL